MTLCITANRQKEVRKGWLAMESKNTNEVKENENHASDTPSRNFIRDKYKHMSDTVCTFACSMFSATYAWVAYRMAGHRDIADRSCLFKVRFPAFGALSCRQVHPDPKSLTVGPCALLKAPMKALIMRDEGLTVIQ